MTSPERGDMVFLTGATGFVGSHVLDALRAAGYRVRALVRGTVPRFVDLAGCEVVAGDLRLPGELVPALRGCRWLVHVAALYSFAPAQRGAMRLVNVRGTAGLLEAARLAGVERAVVTSSSAAVGQAPPGRLATEADWEEGAEASAYHSSKVEQERAALAARLPVVRVLPTAPVGPRDWKPTPTGALVLDFLRGRVRARPPAGGGMNLVPVADVARGHVLALERGVAGRRYLLGGDNLEMDAIWELLAGACGRPVPRWRVPYGAALALAWADELRCRALPGARPAVPLEGVRMARHRMHVDGARAAAELGYRPGPVAPALAAAAAWYRATGYAGSG